MKPIGVQSGGGFEARFWIHAVALKWQAGEDAGRDIGSLFLRRHRLQTGATPSLRRFFAAGGEEADEEALEDELGIELRGYELGVGLEAASEGGVELF